MALVPWNIILEDGTIDPIEAATLKGACAQASYKYGSQKKAGWKVERGNIEDEIDPPEDWTLTDDVNQY